MNTLPLSLALEPTKATVPATTLTPETTIGSITATVRPLLYESQALAVAALLVNTGAYRLHLHEPSERWPLWKSGIRAPVYCNCRTLNGFAQARDFVAKTLAESVATFFGDAQLIVGMATAGIGWGMCVASMLNLPFAYVRTSKKQHGIGGLVDCSPKKGSKAVIVDDLVASGGSIATAIHALQDEGQIEVVGVQSIVNWGFSEMHANLAGTKIKALTSFPQILLAALNVDMIDQGEFMSLLNFYHSPHTHSWAFPVIK